VRKRALEVWKLHTLAYGFTLDTIRLSPQRHRCW
jgi:hypothetical protein